MVVPNILKTVIKVALTTILIVFFADTVIIVADRMLVEARMWSIMEDMEEVAEENNGIPPMYIEHFEERLANVYNRSYLIDGMAHNLTGKFTVNGEEYDTVGTYGRSANSDVRVYNYADTIEIIVEITFSYGSLVTASIDHAKRTSGTVTFDSISTYGRGLAVEKKSVYKRKTIASEVLK